MLSSARVLLMVEVISWDQRVAPLIATVLAVAEAMAAGEPGRPSHLKDH